MIGGDVGGGVELYPFMPKSYETSWYYTCYVSSWFSLFILAFVLIYHVSNEYAYRTVRQNVIDGLTRIDFLKGKFYLLLVLAAFATMYVFVIGMLAGMFFESKPPVDSSMLANLFPAGGQNQEVVFGALFDGVENLFGYFIQIMGYFSFALLLGFLIKKGALAILIYFAAFIVEKIIGAQLISNGMENVYEYFPLRSFSKILPHPDFLALFAGISAPSSINWANVVIMIVYIALFMFLTRLVFLKRDIN
jgi:ABC-type transport system involved in multi-copper enzyme maturation permease subunit